jgi:hypothetical protein
VQLGQTQAARAAGRRAAALGEKIANESVRALALQDVADVLAQAGDEAAAGSLHAEIAQAMQSSFANQAAAASLDLPVQDASDWGALGAAHQSMMLEAAALALSDQVDRALQAAQAIGDAFWRAAAYSRIGWILAQTQEPERAILAAGQAVAAAQTIRSPWAKSMALRDVVGLLVEAGAHGQALRAFQEACITARLAGRKSLFQVLRDGATALAAVDGGQTLWQVYAAIMDVEGWWGRR